MKILLIQSHLGRKPVFHLPVFPIGLSYVAQALHEHEVKIFDMNFWALDEALERLGRELDTFEPDVAGISIRNIDTTQRLDVFYYFKTIRPTARLIRSRKPGITLLVGGPGYSIFARQIMERVPEFDYGIYLEGDESTPELIASLDNPDSVKGIFLRKNGEVVYTGHRPFPDFGSLPAPERSLPVIDLAAYIGPSGDNFGVQTKRGCVLGCAYCGYPFLSGNTIRMRSPESVVDEIESLRAMGVKKFSFVDNIFNVPKSHALAVCREISRRDLDVQWTAWYEVKNFDEELLLAARDAGCVHFGFSPDGASDRTLTLLNKGITRKDLDKCILLIRKHRVHAGFNLFIIPEMSLGEVIGSILFNIRISLLLRLRGGGSLGWIRIEPHTAIHRMAVDNGYLDSATDLFPETEKELAELFYYHRSQPFTDRVLLSFIFLLRKVAVPVAKKILRRKGQS